jgi:sensor histidine kinase regulating citrate/malate metabolism
MSFGISATAWAGFAAASAVAYSAYSASQSAAKANETQQQAMQQAKTIADKQATMQTEQINKANAKSPDTGALLGANQQAAKGGQSGTMLTGPAGIDPNSLSLGKSSLLGA